MQKSNLLKIEKVEKTNEYCSQVLMTLMSNVKIDLILTKIIKIIMIEFLNKLINEKRIIDHVYQFSQIKFIKI